MRMLEAVTLVCLMLSSIACQKQPIADFSTDKTQYTAGDTVHFTNKCKNAKLYKWTMPDGQTSSSKDIYYILSNTLEDGSQTFKLDAMSRNSNKTDEATKTVSVTALKGTLTIWSSVTADTIKVIVDNQYSGIITKTYATTPNCGAIGCFNLQVKMGVHSISATYGGVTWQTAYVSVTKDTCYTFALNPVPLQ